MDDKPQAEAHTAEFLRTKAAINMRVMLWLEKFTFAPNVHLSITFGANRQTYCRVEHNRHVSGPTPHTHLPNPTHNTHTPSPGYQCDDSYAKGQRHLFRCVGTHTHTQYHRLHLGTSTLDYRGRRTNKGRTRQPVRRTTERTRARTSEYSQSPLAPKLHVQKKSKHALWHMARNGQSSQFLARGQIMERHQS